MNNYFILILKASVGYNINSILSVIRINACLMGVLF